MKHCFVTSILYVSLVYCGTAYTTYTSDKNLFIQDLSQYIRDRKSEADTALKIGWLPFSDSLVNYFSKKYEKGSSVDRNELLLLTGYTNEEYQDALGSQDTAEIEKFSRDTYDVIKHEKDLNKFHDQLYDLISRYNAEKLFNDKNLSRPEAIKKMLENKNDSNVKKQFVFGIAVTKTVEDLMKKK